MTGIREVVSDTELLIRNGWAWRYEWSADLPIATTVYHGFVVGPQGAIMLDRSFLTDGDDTLFSLYRETSWTGGVAWTGKNRNDRDWGDATKLALSSAATGVTASPLAADLMGSVRLHYEGSKTTLIAGEGSAIILKPNGSYVIGVANSGTGTSTDVLAMLIVQDRVSSGRFVWPGL